MPSQIFFRRLFILLFVIVFQFFQIPISKSAETCPRFFKHNGLDQHKSIEIELNLDERITLLLSDKDGTLVASSKNPNGKTQIQKIIIPMKGAAEFHRYNALMNNQEDLQAFDHLKVLILRNQDQFSWWVSFHRWPNKFPGGQNQLPEFTLFFDHQSGQTNCFDHDLTPGEFGLASGASFQRVIHLYGGPKGAPIPLQLNGIREKLATLPTLSVIPKTFDNMGSADYAGGNFDGFTGLSYIRDKNQNERVLAEILNPGVLSEIFFQPDFPSNQATDLPQLLRFFFNGKISPIYKGIAGEFFSGGGKAPFEKPFSRAANGGFAGFKPLPFRKLIVTSESTNQVPSSTFHGFKYTEGMGPFDFDQDQWAKLLKFPTQIPFNPIENQIYEIIKVDIPENTKGKIFPVIEYFESGFLSSLEVSVDDLLSLRETRLKIRFDGRLDSVDVPLGALFGTFRSFYPINAALFSLDPINRKGKSYFPMPYNDSVELELLNTTDRAKSIEFKIGKKKGNYPKPFGYFTAKEAKGMPIEGRDFVVFDIEGTGKFVGGVEEQLISFDRISRNIYYQEGDARLFIDEGNHPDLHDEGSEDRALWGWYGTAMDRQFSESITGMSGAQIEKQGGIFFIRRNQYWLNEILFPHYFYENARFQFESGPYNNQQPDLFDVVPFVYLNDQKCMSESQTLNLGVEASRVNFQYRQQTEPLIPISVTSQYMNEKAFSKAKFHNVFTQNGLLLKGKADFIAILPKDALGIEIRARIPRFEFKPSRARIYIDGYFAGYLNNPWMQRDDDLSNPSEPRLMTRFAEVSLRSTHLIAGKNQITISIEPEGKTKWPAFSYRLGYLKDCH